MERAYYQNLLVTSHSSVESGHTTYEEGTTMLCYWFVWQFSREVFGTELLASDPLGTIECQRRRFCARSTWTALRLLTHILRLDWVHCFWQFNPRRMKLEKEKWRSYGQAIVQSQTSSNGAQRKAYSHWTKGSERCKCKSDLFVEAGKQLGSSSQTVQADI